MTVCLLIIVLQLILCNVKLNYVKFMFIVYYLPNLVHYFLNFGKPPIHAKLVTENSGKDLNLYQENKNLLKINKHTHSFYVT